jgi:hypothetical protein
VDDIAFFKHYIKTHSPQNAGVALTNLSLLVANGKWQKHKRRWFQKHFSTAEKRDIALRWMAVRSATVQQFALHYGPLQGYKPKI